MVIKEAHRKPANTTFLTFFYSVLFAVYAASLTFRVYRWCEPTILFMILLRLGSDDEEPVFFSKPATTDQIKSRKSK